eukprot:Pgem_evm1s11937
MEANLTGFVANGSVLPRESGASDKPMSGRGVVTFQAPFTLQKTFQLPHHGQVVGMGIPRGISLIVGG